MSFLIPSMTNSIAEPNNKPNIFCTTVIIVGPNLEANFDESHIANVAINRTVNMGKSMSKACILFF